MSLTNPKNVVTEQRLSEFYGQIYPYLGGMPEVLANKFSKSDLYSTNEKIVGQWIDGRPLYQKTVTIDVTAPSADGTEAYSSLTLPKEIDVVWDFNGVFKGSNNITIEMPFMSLRSSTKTDYIAAAIRFVPSSHQLRVYCNMLGTSGTVYCTIKYTKTGDTTVPIGNDTDYSTEEQIIGTWIDGKPLYQKVIACNGTALSDSWVTIISDVSSLNIDTYIEGKLYCIFNNERQESFTGTELNGNTIRAYVNDGVSGITPQYVILQYTKTTD